MPATCPWLEVGNPAEFLYPEEVSPDLSAKVVGSEVGIADSEAWMKTFGQTAGRSLVLTVEDIGCRYPFDEEDDGFAEENSNALVRFSSPRTPEDCDDILKDLRRVDPRIYSTKWIGRAMKEHLGQCYHSVVAAADPSTGKVDGVLVYHRHLVLHDEPAVTADLIYEIKVFHAEGSPAVHQGLLAALHGQAVADIECALASMHDAGIVADFGAEVHWDDDDGMYGEYIDVVEQARHDAFGFSRSVSASALDIDDFGPWIRGGDESLARANH